ncbi:hypothetical protein B0H13DRAFT_1626830 [Mycena leptocephala]|nr:hypothetical protein B0H13DRAFT_1626830 [Mycena leptocephala]
MVIRSHLLFLYAFAQAQLSLSIVANRTIDDLHGDSTTGVVPVYEGGWNVDSNCTGCGIQLDAGQLHDRTWHDSTQRAVQTQNSVTLRFTGTAIYFFGIVPNTALQGTTELNTKINVTFTLDGAVARTYTHTPDTSTTILYSVPIFSSKDLSNTAHTVVVTFMGLLLFDFATYT